MNKIVLIENASTTEDNLTNSYASIIGEFDNQKQAEDYIREEVEEFVERDVDLKIGTNNTDCMTYVICEVKRVVNPSYKVSAKVTLKTAKEKK